ncbi:arylamine N-acetyltransferase [uncultured Arcobacter sp.]|uniref:arylamine N-acetyltransferase family protein n=1 Tax=uncultured Arcobacter sp. TaxID=165434 RepID=UPI00261EE10A|nr:arylamine N-acetyltransferase [uncultured Arcobacter sp.]
MRDIVKNYLKTLGFDKQISSLDEITHLIKAHLKTFSFSSMTVLLKDEISLDINKIYEKIVINKRGGYCFEHNKLFFVVLSELGFDVKSYMARVVNNTNNIVPKTHRFTILNFNDERYLIDVGIGFRSPCVPVKIIDEFTPSHLGISYCVKTLEKNLFALASLKDEEKFTITNYELNNYNEADYEMGHFYSHKHPSAVFVNNLVISSINDTEIRSLRNDNYIKIYENSQEEILIDSFETFKKIVSNDFNMSFNEEELESIFNNYVKNKLL